MLKFLDFLNETLGVNEDVKKITDIIFNHVLTNVDELKTNKILILNNIIQDNYKNLYVGYVG